METVADDDQSMAESLSQSSASIAPMISLVIKEGVARTTASKSAVVPSPKVRR